jgi:hypothetical protein
MTDDESRWLTYEDAATALGIDAASVKRRAQRANWPRMTGNDRRVLVAVPASALPETGGDMSGDVSPEPLAALMERLTERAIAAEARAAAAEATVAAQAAELRRWVRRAPTKHPGVVLRRLDRLAKG